MLVDQLSGNNLPPLSLGCSRETPKCPGPRELYPSAQHKHLVTGIYEVLLSGREMVRWPYGALGALGTGEDRG